LTDNSIESHSGDSLHSGKSRVTEPAERHAVKQEPVAGGARRWRYRMSEFTDAVAHWRK